ncbi:uncharacterized protein LOC112501607 [Cynara cardunculus var. scolymus]|uniref:uncharacterized protein LOC112501607 n=1 Tax=Cynara cardunculus var. scolymus TaxID=59895 RepID=UPI000D62F821|nr:uncharacterized protein LOC112501607 [Cynara cardunculus var. scolymus]
MNVLQSSTIQFPRIFNSTISQFNHHNIFPSVLNFINLRTTRSSPCKLLVKVDEGRRPISTDFLNHFKDLEEDEEELHDDDMADIDWDKVEKEFSPNGRSEREEEEMNYERDPEFAEILGASLDDPAKAKDKIAERLRRKKDKILHRKTGSATPMSVTFNKFEFSNSYIWIEFYHAPLDKDIKMICDAIRSWHIVGRLGGCNSMNMQLSQSTTDKRPSYDDIQGANVEPSTFYNISDLEIQDNLARIWVDIGTSEPLLLDILINAMTQISSDHVGIKQMVFGGSEFENWRPNLTSEDEGYCVHKI